MVSRRRATNAQHTSRVLRGADDFDPLLRLAGNQTVVGAQHRVNEAAERLVEKPREALGRQVGMLERDRLIVSQAGADDLEDHRPG